MKTIVLKYSGVCKKCGQLLQAGTTAKWERGYGIQCLNCNPEKTNNKLHKCVECGEIGEWQYDPEIEGYVCSACAEAPGLCY